MFFYISTKHGSGPIGGVVQFHELPGLGGEDFVLEVGLQEGVVILGVGDDSKGQGWVVARSGIVSGKG